MKNKSPKSYWKGLPRTEADQIRENGNPHGGLPFAISRRRFLEAAGFTLSFAALSGCNRTPTETALPFVDQPEGMIPGRKLSYASTCAGCAAGCGLLASVRDGRPLKMEGLPEHPLSHGGLCAIGQALPMGLYDSQRLEHPLKSGETSTWNEVDQAMIKTLNEIEESKGSVRFVTSTVTSPTLKAEIDAFLTRFSDGKHITWDAVSCSAILDAHEKTHGERLLPHFRFDEARMIVAFGADFLGTWISPVEFTAAWKNRRVPSEDAPEMSYHVQFEGRMSLTGSNADRRYRLAPGEFGTVLNRLHVLLAQRAGSPLKYAGPADSPVPDADLVKLVDQLWAARGRSLVLCDSQDVGVQVLYFPLAHWPIPSA